MPTSRPQGFLEGLAPEGTPTEPPPQCKKQCSSQAIANGPAPTPMDGCPSLAGPSLAQLLRPPHVNTIAAAANALSASLCELIPTTLTRLPSFGMRSAGPSG